MEEIAIVIKDNFPLDETKGVDGKTFSINLSKDENNEHVFKYGDIITYDKYLGVNLFIKEKPVDVGDSSMYTVQIVSNNSEDFLRNYWLQPGVKYFKLNS